MTVIPLVLEGRRVLVVDDDDDARELIAEVLQDAGADVRTAGDAPRAIAELAAFAPHVFLCDVSMPGEDGYSLIRRVRALPPEQGGRVRAAALTAHAGEAARVLATNAGFDLHVTKPIEPAALARVVAQLADARPPSA